MSEPNSSRTDGRTFTSRPISSARSTSSPIRMASADGTAITSAWQPRARAAQAIRVRSPTTGTFMIERLRRCGSSSTRATGRYGLSLSVSMARTARAPPSPAPNTTTRLVSWADGRRLRSSRTRWL